MEHGNLREKQFSFEGLNSNVWSVRLMWNQVVDGTVKGGDFDRVINYVLNTGFVPDFVSILKEMALENSRSALDFALKLVQHEAGPLVDLGSVLDLFLALNLVQESTSFLLEVLKHNRVEEGAFQTRLLEINLQMAPQVANSILEKRMFSHYDRLHVAGLCERVGLYQWALEHYTDLADIKRVLQQACLLSPEVCLHSNLSQCSARVTCLVLPALSAT